ncbi:phosphonate ABC transporter ATP-binding protein [Chengkuizengella axinellae]|uniref:Phosphonate ABC transporter ATP-binding protein n=1 Tax=Chengkuizengella axinellae TaxID=3064388 RepID=A0ABT9IYI7_9BACL|nr:phosphonate ABC transporter ATP-binding protein [Chengkuizengella sp. 2205SS18-9]MDP5274426.1 phosphonate ABC transporter ATP-binding protein [Chengkuizengella sp. 2205SS18-9]
MMNSNAAIHFFDVSHSYKGNSQKVLNQVHLEIEKGEFCTILGRSGAGKSTFLRSMTGFVQVEEGSIFINGDELRYYSSSLRKIRKNVAMIFQHYNLVNRLTNLQNVLCGMLQNIPSQRGILGWYTEKEKKQALELLDRVGLADFAHKRADQLSGGQKQRVGIARALAQDPKIILADEPVASLDPVTSGEIMELLKQINKEENITVVISLHQIELAKQYGERMIGFAGGKVVIDTTAGFLTDGDLAEIYDVTKEKENTNHSIEKQII